MPLPTRAQQLISRLQLQPHPEGGFFAEVHRATATVDPRDGRPPRAALTSIYFVLADGGFSRWHRVRSDEVWCHLEGAPLQLHLLDARDAGTEPRAWSTRLAPVDAHSAPQATVPADVWQAAQSEGEYSLVACMVAPGFDFADFTMMAPDEPLRAWLAARHPALAALC
ncbi:cupin domain-containing protein [Aquabacterium sp. OR-4]|uniref:cupin domain-containing protein n=1 Tax=Aquabacterium sp. OR-4 TaxID=2978127 RepID=UPI0021B2B4F0|nr:cupin domain-containing protein [Aquabacterium sp. OR-4]MDT7835713.1 cupin domain-containing protein [Aquabacterium sp. OR-4]